MTFGTSLVLKMALRIIIIIIIIIFIITFVPGICNCMPVTDRDCTACNAAAVLSLQFVGDVMLSNDTSSVVPHYYFPKHVGSAQNDCFLYCLDARFPRVLFTSLQSLLNSCTA